MHLRYAIRLVYEETRKMIEAVFFDWDGLLADTESLWTQADKDWLAYNGVIYNGELKSKTVGRNQKDAVELLINHYRVGITAEEGVKQRLNNLKKIYKLTGQVLMPGAFGLIKSVHESGIKSAIVSGTAQDILDLIIDKQGIRQYFDAINSTDVVAHGKPAPDCYLHVAAKLRVNPGKCVVIEDAQSGVVAGKRAGMAVIAVPNIYTKSQDLSAADVILPSLTDVNIPLLEKLMER